MTRPRPIFLRPAALAAALLALVFAAAGCRSTSDRGPRRTELADVVVVLPAQQVGNHLLVETRAGRDGPYRFLVDTGASMSLVSPDYAARHGMTTAADAPANRVRVQGHDGRVTSLNSVRLRRLTLGDVEFSDVQALVYDLDALSLHLGVRVDGILGFPLFRETALTLDYPASRVVLELADDPVARPGVTIPFNNNNQTPLIPIRVGEQTLIALIDSGSDAPLTLNPLGLDLTYVHPPRPGALIATVTGERGQLIGRLADPLVLGPYRFEAPTVELTEGLSTLGGDVLRHFVVTFDQKRGEVTFFRDSTAPIAPEPRLSLGLSFHKTGPYWRVAGVVPRSPAEGAGVEIGDLCVRLDGERVDQWTQARFLARVQRGGDMRVTFLEGTDETTLTLPIFPLVPGVP